MKFQGLLPIMGTCLKHCVLFNPFTTLWKGYPRSDEGVETEHVKSLAQGVSLVCLTFQPWLSITALSFYRSIKSITQVIET